ncbi:Protein METABOLIC NETWORK MODULATOR 1 [Linum perenne]
MSEATAMNNNPGAKRKRGRPRKHPKADLYHEGAYDVMTDQYMSRGYNSNQQENSGVQSGGISGSHPTQQNPVNDDIMLGQPVHGVIEAVFDAGYLLSVRVGNSDTNLKGVVFKPGRYIPVSAENDIAPGVQMIERNKFPIPREDNEHIRRRRYRTREKKSSAHGTHASSTLVSRGGQVLPLMPQTATSGMIPRGNVVPVILQPANVSNGEPSSVAMAPHLMAASKGKAVVDVSVPRSGPSFAQQLAEAEKQVKHQESETMNQQLVPPGAQPQSGLNSNISTAPPASMHIPGCTEERDGKSVNAGWETKRVRNKPS